MISNNNKYNLVWFDKKIYYFWKTKQMQQKKDEEKEGKKLQISNKQY